MNHGSEPTSGPLDKGWIDAFRAIDSFQGKNLLAQLTDIFVSRAPKLLEALRAALRKNNPRMVAEAAHALTSNSSSVGALHLSRCCSQLEVLAAQGKMGEVGRLLPEIEAEYEMVKVALEEQVARSGKIVPLG